MAFVVELSADETDALLDKLFDGVAAEDAELLDRLADEAST